MGGGVVGSCTGVDLGYRNQQRTLDDAYSGVTPWNDPSPWSDRIYLARWRIWANAHGYTQHDPVSIDFSHTYPDPRTIKFHQLVF